VCVSLYVCACVRVCVRVCCVSVFCYMCKDPSINNVLFTGLGGSGPRERNLPKIGVLAAESRAFGWVITVIRRAALFRWSWPSV